ncbi:hypothetical protein LIER_16150 [Lithospermum erythrorhizon]|uniref:Uncharacterized protein n=1 Tax=Lithospermum erythrorhizon TaxID=34254 RepID=A0AAV3Q5Z0_LITER
MQADFLSSLDLHLLYQITCLGLGLQLGTGFAAWRLYVAVDLGWKAIFPSKSIGATPGYKDWIARVLPKKTTSPFLELSREVSINMVKEVLIPTSPGDSSWKQVLSDEASCDRDPKHARYEKVSEASFTSESSPVENIAPQKPVDVSSFPESSIHTKLVDTDATPTCMVAEMTNSMSAAPPFLIDAHHMDSSFKNSMKAACDGLHARIDGKSNEGFLAEEYEIMALFDIIQRFSSHKLDHLARKLRATAKVSLEELSSKIQRETEDLGKARTFYARLDQEVTSLRRALEEIETKMEHLRHETTDREAVVSMLEADMIESLKKGSSLEESLKNDLGSPLEQLGIELESFKLY